MHTKDAVFFGFSLFSVLMRCRFLARSLFLARIRFRIADLTFEKFHSSEAVEERKREDRNESCGAESRTEKYEQNTIKLSIIAQTVT